MNEILEKSFFQCLEIVNKKVSEAFACFWMIELSYQHVKFLLAGEKIKVNKQRETKFLGCAEKNEILPKHFVKLCVCKINVIFAVFTIYNM